MNISKVAKATGLTAKTIRYYESIGLITAPVRSDNGYRSYTEGRCASCVSSSGRGRPASIWRSVRSCWRSIGTNTEPAPR